MPCSCGNTNCPCGIPCCCSEKSCKCQACAIALSRFCKICKKPLITERQTDEDKCSCFMRESTALVFENRNNPHYRMGNIPMPVGHYVFGKLMINVMVPDLRFPQFLPQPPICLMPQPLIQEDSKKILPSFISDENEVNPLCPKENSSLLSTPELHQLDKSSEQSSNHPSASICSNGDHNTEIPYQKTCPSPGFSQSTNDQSVNIDQSAKPKTKERENELPTAELHQLDKSSGQSSDHPSTSICSNGEQNTKIPCQKICPPPGFSQSTNDSSVNIVQSTKPKTKEREDELPTAELPQLLDKSSGKPSNHLSTSICSNGEQNTKISCQKICSPPGILQSADDNQSMNVVQNTKPETEERENIQGPFFYQPSIMIGNISHPVRLADPIWRLSNPAFCFAGNSDSSLKLYNPFYVAGQVNTTETVATYEKESCLPVPSLNFEANGMQCSRKKENNNVQADSTISLKMNEHSLDATKISEQSNVVINGEYAKFAILSSLSVGNESIALPSLRNSDAITSSEQCKISANYSMPNQELHAVSTSGIQTQPLYVASTCASGKNDPTNGFAYQTSDNVPPESSNEGWPKQEWGFPLSEFPLTASMTHIIPEHIRTAFLTSRLQRRTTYNNANSEESAFLQTEHASFVSEMNRRNRINSAINNSIPLYIDPSTTQKMEHLLKSALQ